MTPIPPSDPRAIGQQILAYLSAHPEAADSLEGVASWWLPEVGCSATLEAAQEALALLVAEGRITRIDLADGRTLYQSVDKVSGSHPAWKPTPRRDP
jgi:hypothetical protein